MDMINLKLKIQFKSSEKLDVKFLRELRKDEGQESSEAKS